MVEATSCEEQVSEQATPVLQPTPEELERQKKQVEEWTRGQNAAQMGAFDR